MSGLIGGAQSKSGVVTAHRVFEVDSWRLTADFTGNKQPIDGNLERTDVNAFSKVGIGMTQSSGVFTYPTAGVWKISFQWYGYSSGANRYVFGNIQSSHNSGSDWSWTAVGKTAIPDIGEYGHGSLYVSGFLNVTTPTTFRTRFTVERDSGGSEVGTQGSTSDNNTYMLFQRLGEVP